MKSGNRLCIAAVLGYFAASLALADYGDGADFVNSASGLVVEGDYLYATTGSSRTTAENPKIRALGIFSLANPELPVRLAIVTLEGAPFPQDVEVANGTAYVVDGLNLWTIDVKNPKEAETVVKTLISAEGEKGPRAIALSPDGKRAYLACGTDGVKAYDLSNTSAPKELWTAKTAFSRDVAIYHDGIVSAEEFSGLAFVKDGQVVAKTALPADGAVKVRADGDRLMVANGGELVSVYSFDSETKKFKRLGGYGRPAVSFFGTYSYDVFPAGKQVYVADGETGIIEMDFWPGNTPRIKRTSGKLTFPNIKAISKKGDFLYVSGCGIDGPSGILVFDLTIATLRPLGPPVMVAE